jgi:hypothetical protein
MAIPPNQVNIATVDPDAIAAGATEEDLNPPSDIKLVPPADFQFLQSMDNEVFKLYYYEYLYYPIDRTRTQTDQVYNESTNKKFKAPVKVLAWTDRNPRKRILTRFGFDTPRDLLVVFSTAQLDNITLWPDVGDRIVLDSGLYELKTTQAQGRYPNVNLRFHVACLCDRVPEERVEPGKPSIFISNENDIYKNID